MLDTSSDETLDFAISYAGEDVQVAQAVADRLRELTFTVFLADDQRRRMFQKHGIAAVPHGFRSSFRDWAAEETDHPREVIEAALAHMVQNKVEAAYRRSDLFERRRRLMDDWGIERRVNSKRQESSLTDRFIELRIVFPMAPGTNSTLG